jgi:hypothetical protein
MVNVSRADAVLTGDLYEYLTLVPALSLYSHEILVELPLVFNSSFQLPEDLSELGDVLHRILAIKPLIQIGVVQFYIDPKRHKKIHPSRNLLTRDLLEDSDDPEVYEAFVKLDSYMSSIDLEMARTLFFNGSNEVSYLIRTAAEAPGCFNICKYGIVSSLHLDLLLAISGLTKADRGAENLSKLLAVQVPEISGMAEQVASLRRRSDEFAEWRTRLGAALSSIDGIERSNEEWVSDARATLADELSPITERLKKEVRRSPAIEAMSSGMRTFGLAGVGTVVSGLLAWLDPAKPGF